MQAVSYSLLEETSLLQFLESTSDIFYILDKDFMIRYYNSKPWDQFATENETIFNKEEVIGHNIVDLFIGDETKDIWEKVFSYVLSNRTQVRLPFNCHSATVLRKGVINVIYFDNKDTIEETGPNIIVQSIIYNTRSVPELPIYNNQTNNDIPDYELLSMCSFCKKININDETWVTAIEYYQSGGSDKVNVSHGVCPDCLNVALKEIEEISN